MKKIDMKFSVTYNMSKFILVLFFLCTEIANLFPLSSLVAANGVTMCKDKEREALLTLKKGLKDMSPGYGAQLTSWGNADDNSECCRWSGVECSDTSGHVTGLVLSYVSGEINQALLELRYLSSLDFNFCYFGGNKIPEFFGSLEKLEHLILHRSNFSGDVPYQLGNLTNLRELDLSYNYDLTSKDLTWLSNLSFLSKLDLSINRFEGPLLWLYSNLTLLSRLDLSYNQFQGPVPHLSNLSLLSYVSLSFNQFEGAFPDLTPLSSLSELYLGGNRLTGQLPTSIGQFSQLEALDVSRNSFEGTISEVHFSRLHKLKYLDLSFNSLALNFTSDWIPPFQLLFVLLARCNLGPRFPSWLRTQTNFQHLDLSSAGISDKAPTWLWNFSADIRSLNLSYNQLSGSVPGLPFLLSVDISYNNFSGPIPFFNPLSTLIQISSNMFYGSIGTLCRMKYTNLRVLDLSNNELSGELLSCWENMTELLILDLAGNKFSGHLPHSLGSLHQLGALHFHNNNLTGELPSTLKNCTKLQLIDGGGNGLTGTIPAWLGRFKWIRFLSFRNNSFHGRIPPQICNLSFLKVLDLSHNNMSGRIPRCFKNFSSLVLNKEPAEIAPPMDVYIYREFHLVHGSYTHEPSPYGSYINEANVQWKRQESTYKRTLRFLKLIDLSSNRFRGNIPRELSYLSGLVSLNLSRNNLTGDINHDIDQMKMLECLDLSRNKLSGAIPTGLAELDLLALLDLSSNSLSGKIPEGTQLQSFNASSYAQNKELCGTPLPNCPGDGPTFPPAASRGNQENTEDQSDDRGFNLVDALSEEYFVSVVIGFIVGFWGLVGPLLFKKSWRDTYYGFLSKTGDWLYVTITLCIRRLIRYAKSWMY